MLHFDEARARVLARVEPLAGERVPLGDAVGRVLLEDLRTDDPLPPFDYSAMDGYAVCAAEITEGAALRVAGESRTGGELPGALEPGTVCRVFTGARLPPRADAVVMQELATRTGDRVSFARCPRVGEHLRRAGEDAPAGAVVLTRGTRLTAYHLALLATVEAARVSVARRPAVAIVSTGDELREPGTRKLPGSVVDSNGPALAALVRHCGGSARVMPFARDEPAATRAALEGALEGADLVLTVGGVSVGEHDLVRDALAALGVALDFWKVAIKPGKPLAFGLRGRTMVLGLPGNPASAMVTFVLFGAPVLRALQGDRAPCAPTVGAVLERAFTHATGRLEFVRGWLDEGPPTPVMRVPEHQASGAVTSFAAANALALVPAELASLPAGSPVRCLRLCDV